MGSHCEEGIPVLIQGRGKDLSSDWLDVKWHGLRCPIKLESQ